MMCSNMIVVNAFIKNSVNRNGFTDWHRRSQGEQKGHDPPKFLENIVILCFEGSFSKQNSCYSPKIKHFGLPQTFGLATPLKLRSSCTKWSCSSQQQSNVRCCNHCSAFKRPICHSWHGLMKQVSKQTSVGKQSSRHRGFGWLSPPKKPANTPNLKYETL